MRAASSAIAGAALLATDLVLELGRRRRSAIAAAAALLTADLMLELGRRRDRRRRAARHWALLALGGVDLGALAWARGGWAPKV